MNEDSPRGWYSRGYLPHYDGGDSTQFLTYRLADSLPEHVLRFLKCQVDAGFITDREKMISIERFLDAGNGSCFLSDPRICEMIEENLLRFSGIKYRLFAWVIMPNHVHLLLRPISGFSLSEIVHSCKSYTSNQANKILKRSGRFWCPEPFDRFIRDIDHFEKTFDYIEANPVKAGLAGNIHDWRFSSAWHRSESEDLFRFVGY